ncbi:hypothetical protein H0A66_17205 [Alcaligenaceae bacterium]|nr:hypothetical protein [Alcaligenaceae bacterium]
MTLKNIYTRVAVIGLLAFTLTGCATHYDRKAGNTMMGAGLGAATGAIISGGDPLFTLGGAAAGGILGNVLTEDRSSRNWNKNNNRRPAAQHHRSRDKHRSYKSNDRRRR